MGRDLRQMVIIDNSPQSYIFHPDNAVSFRAAMVAFITPALSLWLDPSRITLCVCVCVCVCVCGYSSTDFSS